MNTKTLLVTLGGAGFSPVGPGTAGSLVAAACALALHFLVPGGWSWPMSIALGVLVWSSLCVWLGPHAVARFGRKDPGAMVLDEAAGIFLTLIFQVRQAGWREAWVVLAAFAAFRVFDIWKPWPARRLEKLPAGWGILLDDLMAGIYANLVCQILWRTLLP